MIFAVQMVLVALIIPLFIALSTVARSTWLTGVIVTYVASRVLPFCVWTLRGFVAVLEELEEAAMVDGSTRPAPSSGSCCR